VITSNRTRGLSDALKRRCLYLHIGMPSFEKELDIVERKVPELKNTVARQIVTAIQRLREEPLRKHPGVSETLDWAKAIDALWSENDPSLDTAKVKRTIGCLLKEAEDIERIDDELIEQMLTTDAESNGASGESLDAE
jgi:MoxR-like ATPase